MARPPQLRAAPATGHGGGDYDPHLSGSKFLPSFGLPEMALSRRHFRSKARCRGAELRVGLSRPLHVVEPGEGGGAQKPRESRPAAPAPVRNEQSPGDR